MRILTLIIGLSYCLNAASLQVKTSMAYEVFQAKQNCYNTTDGLIKYIDEGKGQPIVLLHGVPTSGWMYRKMIPGLVENGFRVIVPDMLGFGNSDNPSGVDVYTPENHAKRLAELMDVLQIETWTQVVHDAGSLWALALEDKYPNRIEKMVLLNSILSVDGINWEEQIGLGLKTKLGLNLQRMGLQKHSFVSHFLTNNLNEIKLEKDEVNGYEWPIKMGKTKAIYSHYTYMVEEFLQGGNKIEKLKIPTTVIWGKLDELLNWKQQEETILARFELNEEDIHLFDAGHLMPEELPTVVDSIIIAFVKPR